MSDQAGVAETERTMLDRVHATWHAESQEIDKRARYIVAEHVNDGAGFGYGRTLDAVVFDTWPSKGLLLHGIEVKVSVADLRKELQDTRKSAAFAPYLDQFSIAAPKGMVSPGMLPPQWGLYQPTEDGRLRAVRKPLMLHDGTRLSVDLSFMAAFCRAIVARSSSQQRLDAAYAEGQKNATRHADADYLRLEGDLEVVKISLAAFEEASGLRINRYAGGRMGEAVKALMDGRCAVSPHSIRALRNIAGELGTVADSLDGLAKELPNV